ncbi:dipeptidase 1-like isoform X2 [Eriocheir sinensis]|nr:dipeptidase 1-like isoform X2 [Eriocheir sinensis]
MAAMVVSALPLRVSGQPVRGAANVSVRVRGSASSDRSSSPQPVRVAAAAPHRERLEAARRLLNSSPLVDGHSKVAWRLHNTVPSTAKRLNGTTDFGAQLRSGMVAAQFWSVAVPCEAQYLNTVQLVLEQVDLLKRAITTFSHHHATLVHSVAEIQEAFRRGRVGGVLGVAGGHGLGSSMGVVRALYDLGVRCLTLTHGCHTPWAECVEGGLPSPNTQGLTPYGKELVLEMNRVGLLLDLSHASASTLHDVLATSRAPVIVSHAAARALCPARTNLHDQTLSTLAEKGGVVLVTFDPASLTCGRPASVRDVVAHINHVRTMAGVDHVGLGAGYNVFNSTPRGLEDASRYPEVFAELLKDASWSLQDLKKLAGLNLLRVMRQVEEVKEELAVEPPSEEIIPIHDIDTRWPCRYKFSRLDLPHT